jgi:uncharacterized protein YjbI with pentapeptide repeats
VSDDAGVKSASQALGRARRSVAAAATRFAHSKARWVLLVAAVVASQAVARARQSVAAGATRFAHSKARWVLLVAAVVGVISGLVILAVGVVPPRLVGPLQTAGLSDRDRLQAEADHLKAINDLRSTLVTALGGALVFTGALIGAVLTSRTIQVNREGQITDRFTKAITQLGDDKLDVRLGAIYALERIARESGKDHGPIMEVLTTYLREHARVQPARAIPWQPVRAVGPLQPEDQARSTDAGNPPRLRADFQAIATVLGRRPEKRRREEQSPLDLREVDLRAADLTGAYLEEALLSEAHLERAKLHANLEGSDLTGAHLEGADLGSAHLKGADLSDAHLEGAKLLGAYLVGAHLHGAHLEGADLRYARLEGANLRKAHLKGADIFAARLEGADLRFANLEGAHLHNAYLRGANLCKACLDGAELHGAHLEGANLRGGFTNREVLAGIVVVVTIAGEEEEEYAPTDLSKVIGLTRAQFYEALTDDTTIPPTFADEAPRTTTSNPPS